MLWAGSSPSLLSQLLPTVYGANRSLGVGVTPDLRVLAFSVALAVVTGVVFGLMPAFRATRIDLLSMMKQAASASPQRRFRITSGQTMVTVQTMLAMLLLIGAGLFIRDRGQLEGGGAWILNPKECFTSESNRGPVASRPTAGRSSSRTPFDISKPRPVSPRLPPWFSLCSQMPWGSGSGVFSRPAPRNSTLQTATNLDAQHGRSTVL